MCIQVAVRLMGLHFIIPNILILKIQLIHILRQYKIRCVMIATETFFHQQPYDIEVSKYRSLNDLQQCSIVPFIYLFLDPSLCIIKCHQISWMIVSLKYWVNMVKLSCITVWLWNIYHTDPVISSQISKYKTNARKRFKLSNSLFIFNCTC